MKLCKQSCHNCTVPHRVENFKSHFFASCPNSIMGKCFWHCSDPKNVSIFHYMVVHVLDIAQAWLTHARHCGPPCTQCLSMSPYVDDPYRFTCGCCTGSAMVVNSLHNYNLVVPITYLPDP